MARGGQGGSGSARLSASAVHVTGLSMRVCVVAQGCCRSVSCLMKECHAVE